jgi:hypothetical protein
MHRVTGAQRLASVTLHTQHMRDTLPGKDGSGDAGRQRQRQAPTTTQRDAAQSHTQDSRATHSVAYLRVERRGRCLRQGLEKPRHVQRHAAVAAVATTVAVHGTSGRSVRNGRR